jgi:hypothetical protein
MVSWSTEFHQPARRVCGSVGLRKHFSSTFLTGCAGRSERLAVFVSGGRGVGKSRPKPSGDRTGTPS